MSQLRTTQNFIQLRLHTCMGIIYHHHLNRFSTKTNLISKLNHISSNKDAKSGETLIQELKSQFHNDLSQKEWNIILKYLRVHGDADEIMAEYDYLSQHGIKLNKYMVHNILSCVMNKKPEYSRVLWKDIMDHYDTHEIEQIFDARSTKILLISIDRLIDIDATNTYNYLHNIWEILINKYKIVDDLYCYTMIIFLFSRYHHQKESSSKSTAICMELLSHLQRNKSTMRLLKQKGNSESFRLILKSYYNLGLLDDLWRFYQVSKCSDYHQIIFLSILSKMDINDKMYIINNHIDFTQMDMNITKYFYRLAIENKDENLQNKLWNIIENNESIKNVTAEFELNDKEYVIETGYKMDEFKSMCLVEKILKETNYKINTNYALELSDDESRRTHLKSHAEKKALAILLEYDNDNDINIRVSMRMCGDCIQFFDVVSKHYHREITCVDPKTVHKFVSDK